MSLKIIHIADVHWRGLSRHKEYRNSFERMFIMWRKIKPDVIYVGGDIVHSKTQNISPELIENLAWWFNEMAKIAPVHVILGNHDGLILNVNRQDAITPIISAIDNDNIFLYKDSGVYSTGHDGFDWCVYSCFDENGWENIKPNKDNVSIALYHGSVVGSVTDINWEIDGELELKTFSKCDYGLFGDIHKRQDLDRDGKFAYCGSTIQQSHGETPGKGFVVWDIKDKDTYDKKFYPVPHDHPYVTIDWQGGVEETLDFYANCQNGSRFRVRTEHMMSQSQIKQIYSALKENKNAKEVVFKFDYDINTSLVEVNDTKLKKKDLTSPSVMKELFREYLANDTLDKKSWAKIDNLLEKYLRQISQDMKIGSKWSIKNMQFDNTFSYCRGNIIDFDKSSSGITGIFGRNRSGKSSIPGTMMYGLFNSSDRGSMKNLHVINTRKGHCEVKIHFSVDGNYYILERMSVKKSTKKGVDHAVTHLNLFKSDQNGNKLEDISEDQRRSTEKTLRSLIGTYEDFLLTSFASQGEMNAFIKMGATQRKETLSSFLALGIFNDLHSLANEESLGIKQLLKKAPKKSWKELISLKNDDLDSDKIKRKEISSEIEVVSEKIEKLKSILASMNIEDQKFTTQEVNQVQKQIDNFAKMIEEKRESNKIIESQISDLNVKISSIQDIKESINLKDLKSKIEETRKVENSVLKIEHKKEKAESNIKLLKKSVSLLDSVPCGDEYPTCKFIKKSHKDKLKIEETQIQFDDIKLQLREVKKDLRRLKKNNYEEKITKYHSLLELENDINNELSSLERKYTNNNVNISTLENSLREKIDKINYMKVRISDDEDDMSVEVRSTLRKEESILKNLDANRIRISETIGRNEVEVKRLISEMKEYEELQEQWKVYEILLHAVSKKGIPFQIIKNQLPLINKEIGKILHEVTNFTVQLRTTSNTSMDIILTYGDSERIIECASGMEKMIASIAIRVALINVSSLPKSDMLLIDEGFGSLDESNVESCNRLLTSLKKWFRNILVISHVPQVKEIADNIIDINKIGNDSHVIYT